MKTTHTNRAFLCTLLVVLSLLMLFSAFAVCTLPSFAAETSGTCGGDIVWTLNDGVLSLTGTGPMDGYDYEPLWWEEYYAPAPWYSSKDAIVTVQISDGVTSIGDSAFLGCSNLTTVHIPESVTSIGMRAFEKCTSLALISIPKSATRIYAMAFNGCAALRSVAIPEGVTVLSETFAGCTSLESVYLPASVKEIDNATFRGCTALKDVYYAGTEEEWMALAILGDGPLTNAEIHYTGGASDVSWTLSNGVLTISGTGRMKDYGGAVADRPWADKLDSIKKLVVEDGVTYIGSGAFMKCEKLEEAEIGRGMKKIGMSAFDRCYMLKSITFNGPIEEIGPGAFDLCSSLTDVYLTGQTAEQFLVVANNNPYNVPLVNAVKSILPASGTCGNGVTWTYAEGVLKISGNGAMKDYWFIDDLTPWQDLAKYVKTLVIEDGVTAIGRAAFASFSRITSVVIPDSVISIGPYAFDLCRNLTSVTVGRGITEVEASAFFACDALTDVNYAGSKEDWAVITIEEENEPLKKAVLHANYVPAFFGDMNGDSIINKKDSLALKKYLADNTYPIDLAAADVNKDGFVNKKDSLRLKQYLAGWDVKLGA